MKRLSLLLFICLWAALSVLAQTPQRCTSKLTGYPYHSTLNPDKEKLAEMEARLAEYLQNNPAGKTNATINIPVVVHVLYNTPQQNISDAQIISQITVLNKDYNAQSFELQDIPSAFSSLVGSADINFQLATTDPSGNATNGIHRVETNKTVFSAKDGTIGDIHFTAQGGADAWDPNHYLNMWVANLEGDSPGSILLGFSSFPDIAGQATDGVVIHYNRFGRIGQVVSPNDRGRTATHEVGHWLNLKHIWGDANCGSDDVNDTPIQESENLGCPGFPKTSCGGQNAPNGELFMNFMDYVDDACMYMFTNGQVARMRATFDVFRASILTTGRQSDRFAASQVSFSLFPNPTRGAFQAHFPNTVTESVQIEVVNVNGQTVFSQTYAPEASGLYPISLQNAPSGLYFVRATGESFSQTMKLVVE